MPRSTSTVARFAVAALLVVATAGCIEGLKSARERTGFITATVYRDSAGNVGMRPVAAFYKADGLELPGFTTDTCFHAAYSPNPPLVSAFQTLQAGEFLVTNVSGRTDTLDINASLGLIIYELRDFPFFPFTPGDTLTVTMPGTFGEFPAAQLKVRTAEPFTVTPPDTAARETDMLVTWTAAASPGARMYISLRYSSTNVGTVPDHQYFCDVADDGAVLIKAPHADAFRNSPYEARSIFYSRARTSSLTIDELTKVHLLSTYDFPLTIFNFVP